MQIPLPHERIIGIPVVTESGAKLGKVSGFALDPAQHVVVHYRVKPHNPIKDLVSEDLLIAPAQVLSLDERQMTVEDLEDTSRSAERAVAPSV